MGFRPQLSPSTVPFLHVELEAFGMDEVAARLANLNPRTDRASFLGSLKVEINVLINSCIFHLLVIVHDFYLFMVSFMGYNGDIMRRVGEIPIMRILPLKDFLRDGAILVQCVLVDR